MLMFPYISADKQTIPPLSFSFALKHWKKKKNTPPHWHFPPNMGVNDTTLPVPFFSNSIIEKEGRSRDGEIVLETSNNGFKWNVTHVSRV